MADRSSVTQSSSRANVAALIEAFKRETVTASITPLRDGTILERLMNMTREEADALEHYISLLSQQIQDPVNFGSIDFNDLDHIDSFGWDLSDGLRPCRFVVFYENTVIGSLDVFADKGANRLCLFFSTALNMEAYQASKKFENSDPSIYFRTYTLSGNRAEIGTWSEWKKMLPDLASSSKDGLMSKEDKSKLDGMPRIVMLNGTLNSNFTTIILSGDAFFNVAQCMAGKQMALLKFDTPASSGQSSALVPVYIYRLSDIFYFSFLYRGAIYTVNNFPISGNVFNTAFPLTASSMGDLVSQTADGLMSKEDKKKLDGISDHNLVRTITIQEMFDMQPSDYIKNDSGLPVRFSVVDNNVTVGTLDVFADNMYHQFTQVLTSNCYRISRDGGSHIDGKIFVLYRCCGTGLGGDIDVGWTDWKEYKPDLVSQTADGLMSYEDKTKLDGIPKVVVLNGTFNTLHTNLSLLTDANFRATECLAGRQLAFIRLSSSGSESSALIPVTIYSLSGVFYFSFRFRNSIYTINNFPTSGNINGTIFSLTSTSLEAVATQTANGLMSSEDKKKLDNLIKIQVLDLLIDDECTDQPLPAGFQLPETDNTGAVIFGRIRDAGSCLVPCVSMSNYQSRWHFYFRTSNLSFSVSINTSTSTYSVQIQNLLPPFTTSQRTDGITYGFKNGQLEKVADAGKDVLNADAVTATSLALGALNTCELAIDSSTPPEMIEEVRELLGDELFNEFSAKAVQTMELAPVLSDKEMVEQAKAVYYERKAEMERLVKEMQEQARLDEGKSNLDVEQSKSE